MFLLDLQKVLQELQTELETFEEFDLWKQFIEKVKQDKNTSDSVISETKSLGELVWAFLSMERSGDVKDSAVCTVDLSSQRPVRSKQSLLGPE